MSKDFKDKYERVCAVKDRALSLLEMGMNQDVKDIDAKEIGELMDIVKDAEEAIKYAEEACYFSKVTKAMEEGSDEEKSHYLNKYIPEYEGKFYTPMYARQRDSRGRYMYTEPYIYDDRYEPIDRNREKMYYTEPRGMHYSTNSGSSSSSMNSGSSNYARDMREGRSPLTRRTYMEHKNEGIDKVTKIEDIKKYSAELIEDLSEMLEDASPEEKAQMKNKLATFLSKL